MIWTKRDYLIAVIVLGLGLTAGFIVRAVIHNRINAEADATVPATATVSGPLIKTADSYQVSGFTLNNTSPSLNLDQLVGKPVQVRGYKDNQVIYVTSLEEIR